MDDRARALLGQRGDEVVSQRVECRQVGGLRCVPLLHPPPKLSLHEPGRPAELRQPDRAGLDGMKIRQGIDERLAEPAAILRCLGVAGGKRIAADVADDALHQVERSAERAFCIAEMERARNRHGGVRERGHDAILATHVVRGGKDVTERGTSQDDLTRVARDAVGQVRLAARDQRYVTAHPSRVIEDLGEHRPDDLRVGSGRDPLQPLGRGIVEPELLGLGHAGSVRHRADPTASRVARQPRLRPGHGRARARGVPRPRTAARGR